MRQRRCLIRVVLLVLILPLAVSQRGLAAEESAALRSLHAFFAAGVVHDGARAELVSVGPLPEKAGRLHWMLPNLRRYPRHFSLIAEQLGGARSGRRARRWFVPVTVRWMAPVAVARSDIPARAVLDRSMVTIRSTDIAGHDIGFSSPASLDGLRLLRRVRRGEPIFAAITHRLPLIKRGQMVTIEARYGSVQVSTAGKALRAARRGELVLVENLRSKRKVEGRVVNARTVRVVLGGEG